MNVEDSFNHSRSIRHVRRLPQAIIIGSRKCGTRALLKFLELNPKVKGAQSEVHFFDRPNNYELGLDWYESQMPESSPDEITIEKSPAYFVTNRVPERIKSMNSSIKLILIMRNPVTRLISDYSQLVANKIDASLKSESIKNESISSEIEQAWEEAGKVFEKHVLRSDGGINDRWKAVKVGLFSYYLEKWRNFFPLSQFHFVDGEALISDPYTVIRELEIFLNLKPTVRRDNFVFNSQKGYYCSWNLRLENHIINDDSKQYPGEITCLSKHKGRRHINVSAIVKDKLRKYYAPYNQYLYSLIGRDWNWS